MGGQGTGRGSRLLRITVVVVLVAAAVSAPLSASAGVGEPEEAGTAATFPAVSDATVRLRYPTSFRVLTDRLPWMKAKIVFPHIAVVDRPSAVWLEHEVPGAHPINLDAFADQVRAVIERLWSTRDGFRLLSVLQRVLPEQYEPAQRWRMGIDTAQSRPGANSQTIDTDTDALIAIFPAKQSVRVYERGITVLDPEGGKTGRGSGSGVPFNPASFTGALQADGRIQLESPELSLAHLLIEAMHPLVGADARGDLLARADDTVHTGAGTGIETGFVVQSTQPVRALLAHGGEPERAVANLRLRIDGRAGAWDRHESADVGRARAGVDARSGKSRPGTNATGTRAQADNH